VNFSAKGKKRKKSWFFFVFNQKKKIIKPTLLFFVFKYFFHKSLPNQVKHNKKKTSAFSLKNCENSVKKKTKQIKSTAFVFLINLILFFASSFSK